MSQTLTISDRLHERLAAEAKRRGLASVESLLEAEYPPAAQISKGELAQRREAVDRILELQARLSQKYGMMPDSVDLVREDRER